MFKIGQQVICIDSTNTEGIVQNQIYTIINIIKCECGRELLEIKESTSSKRTACKICLSLYTSGYYKTSRFAPIQSQYTKISYSKILEQVEMCEN